MSGRGRVPVRRAVTCSDLCCRALRTLFRADVATGYNRKACTTTHPPPMKNGITFWGFETAANDDHNRNAIMHAMDTHEVMNADAQKNK